MSDRNVVIVGSCMIDFTSYATRLPTEGETIHGSKFVTSFGGKGANQCVAAAKLGAKTSLIARVGDDVWGEKYIHNLKDLNVDTKYMHITRGTTSGIAQINVADSGANQIVIIAGANNNLCLEDVEDAKDVISKAYVVVCQLETSPDVAIRTIQLCKGISILNGAPALSNCAELILTLPTIFCVNESEASIFAGLPVANISDAKNAIRVLLEKGCNTVILTLGAEGAIFASKDSPNPEHVTAPSVKCVDSTGAGDAFIGALAFLLSNRGELTLKQCIQIANYVAADSVTRPGSQISFPGPDILDSYNL